MILRASLAEPSTQFGRQCRIQASVETLKSLKIAAGDIVAVKAASSDNFVAGIAWPSFELDNSTVLLPLSQYQTLEPTPQNGQVSLQRVDGNASFIVQTASQIQLRELVPRSHGAATSPTKNARGKETGKDWLSLLLRESLVDIRYLVHRQNIQVSYEGRERSFEVVVDEGSPSADSSDITKQLKDLTISNASKKSSKHSATASATSSARIVVLHVTWDTVVTVLPASSQTDSTARSSESTTSSKEVPDRYSMVGGLSSQISEIRDLIEIPLARPELFRQFGIKPSRGILLHGPPGTGKTHLALTIANSLQHSSINAISVSVFHISGPELHTPYHGETESKLRAVFQDAREKSPSIIILDEVDAICPKRDDGESAGIEGRVVATLLGEMDGLESGGEEQRVIVIATTNRPNAIDPALRRPGRFDKEIEIGVPSEAGRAQILQVLLQRTPHDLSPSDIVSVASKTHGYVGADLAAVVRTAGTTVIKRIMHRDTPHPSTRNGDLPPHLTLDDILLSLPSIQPSALRSLTLPVHPTYWSSLGGKSTQIVRQKLMECISWPLLFPASFERLGVQPPKGVLMYGPPGCSKTMVGRALATEAKVNFLAIRGPELLSKYVGESERAVRELFSKARSAKPCIIFFDEIDALATSRSEFSEGAHNGVLTSLLNEMDGVQDSTGVVVVGATNRPEVLDSALMRPGRLDRLIYVGPPSHDDRIEILKIKFASMAVDAAVDVEELAKSTEGCSGAELTAMCRDAALMTMSQDMNATVVHREHLVSAAKQVRRQITKDMLDSYQGWRERTGLSDI